MIFLELRLPHTCYSCRSINPDLPVLPFLKSGCLTRSFSFRLHRDVKAFVKGKQPIRRFFPHSTLFQFSFSPRISPSGLFHTVSSLFSLGSSAARHVPRSVKPSRYRSEAPTTSRATSGACNARVRHIPVDGKVGTVGLVVSISRRRIVHARIVRESITSNTRTTTASTQSTGFRLSR